MARDPDKPETGSPSEPAGTSEPASEQAADSLTDQELSDQVARVVALLQKLETLHSEQQKAPSAPEEGLAQLGQRPSKERPAPLAPTLAPSRVEPLPSRNEPPRWISDATDSDDDADASWRRYAIPAGIGLALLIAIPSAFLLMPSKPRVTENAATVTTANSTRADTSSRTAGVIAADAEARDKAEEERRIAAETAERTRLAAEAEARRKAAELEARAAEAEAKRKADEEKRLAAAEAEASRKAEEEKRLAAEAESRRKAEEEKRLATEAEARRKADEEKRLATEAEARRKAEEEKRLAAEAEARRKAEEEKRLAAEAEARRKAEEEKRLAAEAEARRKAEEEKRLAAEAEARRKAEEEKRLAAEAEAKRRAEEEKRLAAEAEAKRRAEEEKRLAAEALARRIADETPPARQTTTTAALSGTLAPGAVRGSAACADSPKIDVEPLPGGRTRILVSAPCRAGEPVTVWYGPFSFVQKLDSAGRLDYPLDLFMGESVITRVGFSGGSEERIAPKADDIAQVSKVAVIWKAPVNLDLHAFEYLARPGGRGHVWAGAPSSAEKAKAEAVGGKVARGFLSSSADTTTLGDKVEVYTLWNVAGQESGVVSTAIDFESRGDTPAGETCGDGKHARASYRLLLFARNQIFGDEQRVLAPAACGEALSREVRFNPDTSMSLSVRRQ